MSLRGVSFSPVVLNGLFWIPSILLPACTISEGKAISRSFSPTAAAPAAADTPSRNLRRLRYRFSAVISDEGMSEDLLININKSSSLPYFCASSSLSVSKENAPSGHPDYEVTDYWMRVLVTSIRLILSGIGG